MLADIGLRGPQVQMLQSFETLRSRGSGFIIQLDHGYSPATEIAAESNEAKSGVPRPVTYKVERKGVSKMYDMNPCTLTGSHPDSAGKP